MKVSTMRRMDAWIGVPLCLLATALRGIFGKLFRRSAEAGSPKRVLIIKLSELGALVTLGPALSSLAGLVGRQNLYFLTFGESRGLLEILDYVPQENIALLPTGSLGHFLREMPRQLIRLRRKRIDCSLDLDFFSRATALIAWLIGCRRRVGCHAYYGEGPYRGNLLTHKVKFNPHIHVSQMFSVLAQAVRSEPGSFPRIEFVPEPAEKVECRFQPTEDEMARVADLLRDAGVDSRAAVILLNSNISDREAIPLRKWSDERYVELAHMILAGMPECFILLTGGKAEATAIARLAQRIGHQRCRSLAGKTTLRELLTLYGMSAMIVTNDSGPAHFATLTGIRVVVLFGPETPHLWRPLGSRVHVVYRGLACSPCFTVYNGRQSKCRRNACMDIDPAEVFRVVRQQLAAD